LQVKAQAEQFEADLAHQLGDFEQRLRALERRFLQAAIRPVTISPRIDVDRENDVQ